MQAQTLARPRFRQDLVAELVEEHGQRFIDVGDPDTGNIFRFYEVEYSLACAMDGERDVAGIVRWAQEELGLTPTANEIQTVIATLADLRFIDAGDAAADARVAKAATPHVPPAGSDRELARGVVVGPPPAKAPSGIEVELGNAGVSAPAPVEELPPAPALDLGAPGASASAGPPAPPVEDIALGAPGASPEPLRPARPPQSEVSIDLSAHVAVRPDDVKEAVRQSKVMTAVEVPKELLEAEASATPPAVTPRASAPVVAPPEPVTAKLPEPVAPSSVSAKRAEPAQAPEPVAAPPADKAAEPVSDKPVEKPVAAPPDDKAEPAAQAPEPVAAKPAEPAAQAPESVAAKPADKAPAKPAVEPAPDKPIAPPAPRTGVSPFLVVLLILAVVGAGAFFVWKFYLNQPTEAPATSQVAPPELPPAPPPPVVLTSKVALEIPAAQEIQAAVAGKIEWLEANDADVKTGDVIARLAGGAPIEADIAKLNKDIAKIQAAIDKANQALAKAQQAANNDRAVRSAQAKLDKAKKPLAAKQEALAAKQAALDGLAIKSTADGKLTAAVAVGDKVDADAVIAKVQREPMHVATFPTHADLKVAADGTVSVTAGERTIVCSVLDLQATSITLRCPPEGLPEGTELTLTLPR